MPPKYHHVIRTPSYTHAHPFFLLEFADRPREHAILSSEDSHWDRGFNTYT